MKRTFIFLVLLSMLVVTSQVFAVNKQVSLNFAQGGNQDFAGGQLIGPLVTDSLNWNSTIDLDSGTLPAGTLEDLIDVSGIPTGINAEWTSGGVYYNGDGTGTDEKKLAVGYLDDSGSGPSFTLTNIPYVSYDAYILFTSDNNGDYSHNAITVNGTEVLSGSAFPAHGRVTDGTGWVECDGTVNGNYVKVTGLTDATLTVSSLRDGSNRAPLTGVVIVSDEIAPAPQRSISTNFLDAGWDYHRLVSASSNDTCGYFDPNGIIPIEQVPTATWNEGEYITDTYLAKDHTGSLGSAIAVHSGDFNWNGGSSGYVNITNYLAGSPVEDTNDPWLLEDAKNRLRVSQHFMGHNGNQPKKPLTTLKRVPYGDYMVVTYMHPNRTGDQQEIQIEDQSFFYLNQNSGGDYGGTWLSDTFVDGFKWNVARDSNNKVAWLLATETTSPATKQANIAIFRHLSATDMTMIFDTLANSGISAYSLISEVSANDVVTQITPGNINKNYGGIPASIDSLLSWDAPANGADSYDVYFSEYGGVDPNVYLVDPGNTTGQFDPTLEYGKTYVWRVDTVRGDETFTGDYFYFDVEGDPVVMIQPRSVSVQEGADTFFDIDAVLTGNYAWYYSPDAANDTPGDDILIQDGPDAQVDIIEVAPEDVGYYYVVLTNTIPDSATVVSEVASLVIGQQELYLPFNGDMNDASGNEWEVYYGNREPNSVDPNFFQPTMGTISYETGWDGIGQAAKFTRTANDQLEVIGSDDYFNFYPKGFTVRFWAKPDNYDDAGIDGYMTMIAKDSGYWNPGNGWRMLDRTYWGGWTGTMLPHTINAGTGRLDDGEWHLLACTYDGATQEMKLYQNGYLKGTVTGSLNAPISYPVVIGRQVKSGTTYWGYNGLLDDVEIFSYAISEYDMLEDYAEKMGLELCIGDIAGDVNKDCKVDLLDFFVAAGQWLDTTNPSTGPKTRVVNWKFDEITGMTAMDSSGNGIAGTLGVGFSDDADAQWIIDGGRTGTSGDHALYINGDPNTSVIADASVINKPFANGAGNTFEGTASWTMNLWIKYASAEAAAAMTNIGGFGYNEFPGDPDPDGNSDRYFASYSGGYEFEVGQDGIWPSTPLTAEWQMLTATYDGTTCTVYYNGVQVSQGDVALVDAIEEININTARDILWNYGVETVSMNATVDDFSIWSETFTAAQVMGMYENAFPSCDGALEADLNGDCDVNLEDFRIIVGDWLECNRVPSSLCN